MPAPSASTHGTRCSADGYRVLCSAIPFAGSLGCVTGGRSWSQFPLLPKLVINSQLETKPGNVQQWMLDTLNPPPLPPCCPSNRQTRKGKGKGGATLI